LLLQSPNENTVALTGTTNCLCLAIQVFYSQQNLINYELDGACAFTKEKPKPYSQVLVAQ
jgi:hypothetical protein